jgi:eukaryotic-like serine/threonine-protein kinase
MPLSAGTRLGPYQIVAPLGAGGMGEVYRARDTRLGREVALKILPDEVAGDSSRRQRFELEARAVAALNHPNIVAVYDVGEGYIVSELVDGATLRDARFGARKTVEIAIQIADGMAAAHAAGITHRDLKPDNILLARDGRVKILDFGLAKMTAARAAAATETVTVASEPGVVMGTVRYMSPEQVRGQTVDQRSDIFSFGLVLYELLTGKGAFNGDTSAETMTAILKQEAPELPDAVPAGVRQIVAHCLEKDAANRFQSAKDLAFALRQVERLSTTSPVPPVVQPRRRKLLVAAGALAGLTLAFAAGHALWRTPPAPQWSGELLGGPDVSQSPRPSPDGRLVAFTASDSDGVMQVWVMKPESGDRMMLTHRRDRGYASSCSWSRDGSRIIYNRWSDQPRGIFSVPVLGGEEQMLLESGGSAEALPDGSLLINLLNPQHQFQLYRFWPDSGRSQSLPMLLPDDDVVTIRVFADGRRALVTGKRLEEASSGGWRSYVIDLESGKLTLAAVDPGDLRPYPVATVSRDGKSIFYASGHNGGIRIFSVPVDGNGPRELLFHLTSRAYSLDTGVDGGIYLDQHDRRTEILRFAPEGGKVEQAAFEGITGRDYLAALPDGRVVWIEDSVGRRRLMSGGRGREPSPAVNTTEEVAGPLTAIGADGVAFLIGGERSQAIGVATLSNGRVVSRVPFDKGAIEEMAASPDGTMLYCAAAGSIWAVPVSGAGARRIRAGNSVAVEAGGTSLVVESLEPNGVKLLRVPLNGGPEQELPLTGEFQPAYGIDNGGVRNGLLISPGSSSYWFWPPVIFDLKTGKSTRVPLDYTTDFHHMSWTPDGKIVASAASWHSQLWRFLPEQR